MEGEQLLKVKDLSVGYDVEPVIYGMTFTISEARIVSIIGPNGAGKTTLLRGIMGTLPRLSGTVSILGDDSLKASREVAYVPQHSSIDWDFPATVYQVVMQGRMQALGLFRRPKEKDEELVWGALEKVGMREFAQRQIGQLSGGQRQRVFLARSLAQNKRVTILDEPFQGVDAGTERAIIGVMRAIRDDGGTVIVVHHDLSTVKEYFDDVLMVNKKLIAFGSVGQVFTEGNLKSTFGGGLTIIGTVAS